ncbi:MAG: NYN domain-containing protein [Pseudomonadota bacterium]|nr:NYN domain-containing protein [Pseudomonadota bacterium]
MGGGQNYTKYKWLDYRKLLRLILLNPAHEIKIKYFTARVSSSKKNLSRTNRQQRYWDALKASDIEIIEGQHSTDRYVEGRFEGIVNKGTAIAPKCIASPACINIGDVVRIKKNFEKQTDVNLGMEVVKDIYENNAECVVLVSNDTDFVPTLKFSIAKLGRGNVGVVFPVEDDNRSMELQKIVGRFSKVIREEHLINSMFPDQVVDANGCAIFNPWLEKKKHRH